MKAFLYFKTQFFEYKEQKAVQKRFYGNLHFKQIDEALLRNYDSKCPYTISKNYHITKQAKNLHVYGETPLTTMERIATECKLSENDLVIEMGAGRGRAALFLAEFIGCKVVAYEKIEEFVQKMPPSKNLTMVLEDMYEAPLAKASWIYLYGTLLEEEEILLLCKKFPAHAKVVTVSYPLSAYDPDYQTLKSFPGRFAWGETEIFINERIV